MKQLRRLLWLIICLMVAWAGSSCAEENETQENPTFILPAGDGSVELHTEIIEEEPWLFLPAFARLDQLSVNGYELEWWDTEADEEGLWYVDILYEEEPLTVNVMRSENLRALFLFSDDPVNQGIAYIETSSKHTAFTTASLAIVDTQGQISHAESITNLRGRGNWTWSWPKKGYQIKLENRVDLLDTGDEANRARTWVLLAEGLDSTLLHNRLTADLAKELGISGMDSEFVDLYYDGAYRGTYLLCEKVQVGEGRVDILDYDKLLKKWNNKVGQYDLEVLPVAEDINRYGKRFTYVEGIVEDSRPGIGGFFVEMESKSITLSNRCYFALEDNSDTVYAVKNPENASRAMMSYISERLKEAQDTLRAGGVNPANGRTLEDDFAVDAFVRTMLLQEFGYNVDGYTYSSSYFVLPDGSSRFEPGPVWDFDLGYRYFRDSRNAGGAGFKDAEGWVTDFYGVPSFLERTKEVYQNELYPLIQQVLLGDGKGTYLQSLNEWQEYLGASAAMNLKRWGITREGRFRYGDSYQSEIALLRQFITQRSEWLYHALNDLQPESERQITLWMDVGFTNPDDSVRLLTAPWQKVTAEVTQTEQLTEADEENYALWKMEAVVSAWDGRSLEGYTLTLNGVPMTVQLQEDGSLLIHAQYEDQSYRPVDYYGDDVGMIYDYEKYIAAYPEVAEECGYDEQAVMDYFFDEGVYEAHVGNGLFDPKEIAELQPYVYDSLYDEWVNYYWEFLSWGYESEWTADTLARFVPEVADLP